MNKQIEQLKPEIEKVLLQAAVAYQTAVDENTAASPVSDLARNIHGLLEEAFVLTGGTYAESGKIMQMAAQHRALWPVLEKLTNGRR